LNNEEGKEKIIKEIKSENKEQNKNNDEKKEPVETDSQIKGEKEAMKIINQINNQKDELTKEEKASAQALKDAKAQGGDVYVK